MGGELAFWSSKQQGTIAAAVVVSGTAWFASVGGWGGGAGNRAGDLDRAGDLEASPFMMAGFGAGPGICLSLGMGLPFPSHTLQGLAATGV